MFAKLLFPLFLSVFASSDREVQAAYADLSAEEGGGTIYLSADFPPGDEIALQGGGDAPVEIAPAEDAGRVQVSRIALTGVENLTIRGLHVDSTGVARREHHQDVDIRDGGGIAILDTVFTSNGRAFYDPADPASVLGERLAMIIGARGITLSGIEASGYSMGVVFRSSTDVVFTGNDLHTMQGDGLRLIDVWRARVADNLFHDFAGTTNEFNHNDFIQMWPSEATATIREVTIEDNVFDTGNGASIQAIFMGNPRDRTGEHAAFRDLVIRNNLIYSASANGIGVHSADGVTIQNNTLLWNTQAFVVKADGNTSFPPRIFVGPTVANALVTDNVAPRIILRGTGGRDGSNVEISWEPGSPYYVDRHFTDVARGGDIGPGGWRLRDGSPLVGLGAAVTQPRAP
ncbi:hypothetical protein HKCCE2091_20715 [Rhodobacterales bacterium HKCCE2091]|nr:hypothetical protein [Rhodobacterales bacterium HKCCE2091]